MTTTSLQTTKIYKDHLILPSQLVVIFDWGDPVVILEGNERFEKIKDLLESGETYNMDAEVDVAFELRKKMRGKFSIVDGLIMIGEETLPLTLSDMLLTFLDANLDTTPLENFWDNLKKNPAESARHDLFAYLKANKAPLTLDGHFIAYKRVKDDYWDSHTGRTHLNKPGMTISMPREDVDADRRNTCSAGLHVAAWGFASTFSGERTLLIKINPRDVVAVPPDYNEQKMRVCKYLVLGETKKAYNRSIYEEALVKNTPSSEVEGEEVKVEDDETFDCPECGEEHYDMDAADYCCNY